MRYDVRTKCSRLDSATVGFVVYDAQDDKPVQEFPLRYTDDATAIRLIAETRRDHWNNQAT